MAGGKFASLQRQNPLQGDITTDLLNAEDQEFKHRAEKRLIADRTKGQLDAEKKAQKEQADAKAKKLAGLYINKSGYNSHDEAIIDALQGDNGILIQYSNLLDQIKEEPNNSKLLAKQITLEKSVETLRGLKDGMVARATQLKKGLENGTLSKSLNKGLIDNYDAMIKDYKYKYSIKDNGEIVIENQGYDPDGDGIPNELTMQDVWDPEKMKLQGYFDPKAWVKGTKDILGKHDTTTDNGITSKRLVGFDPTKSDSLVKEVENVLGKDLENMTPQAKSYINDTLGLNYKDFTEKDFTKVKDSLANQTKNAYDSIDTTKVDGGTALANKKYKDEQSGDTKGVAKVETVQYGKGKNAVAEIWAFNKPYVISGTGKSSRPKELTQIRYDKQNGKIVLIGKEYHGSETKKTVEGNSVSKFSVEDDSSKVTSSTKEEDWKDVTITDKSEVTSILSKVMGLDSYEAIVKQLRGREEETKIPVFD